MAPILSAKEIAKSYHDEYVFRNLSFELSPGEFVLFLGSNGSGKSTLLKLLAGLIRPERGEIVTAKNTVINYLGHNLQLYSELSVYENLELSCEVIGIPCARIASIIKRWGLEDRINKKVRELSKGQQQKLALARALLAEGNLIILDEPTTSLDDSAATTLLEILGSLRTKTVIVATHDLSRFSGLVNRLFILNQGKLSISTSFAFESIQQQYLEIVR